MEATMRAPRAKTTNKPEKLHALVLKLPESLVKEIDAIAAEEERPRTKTIERVLRQWVQDRRAA
jgi:metal-responsive CopG/Arc/MetJ family transcriptional regulator